MINIAMENWKGFKVGMDFSSVFQRVSGSFILYSIAKVPNTNGRAGDGSPEN